MLILSQAAVLLLLALIAAAFLFLLRNGNKATLSHSARSENLSQLWNSFGKDAASYARGGQGETMFLPMLFIDQLDPKTMESVKQFPVCDIPENGVTISRPNASSGGILLSKATREAYTVSANHAKIGMDEDGMFIQDCGSHNKMYAKGSRKAADELEITDGMIVYLGMQPLRFSIPCLYGMDDSQTDSEEQSDPPTMTQIYGNKSPLKFAGGPVMRRKRK